jgi:hypothetical protein
MGVGRWRAALNKTNHAPTPGHGGRIDYHMFRVFISSEGNRGYEYRFAVRKREKQMIRWTRDGPRCIQAAAGPCFGFAKRAVICAVPMCKITGAWPSRPLSHGDIKLSAAAFRPGSLGFRVAVTPRLSGSVTLSRWSHGFSLAVEPMGSRKKAPSAPDRLL